MATKKRSKKRTVLPPFLGLHYALLDDSINVYGAVKNMETDQEGNLKIHLIDGRAELNVCVKKECIDLFKLLEVGDVLRCYRLEKKGPMAIFSNKNDMQCAAWSPTAEDFTLKFATSENEVAFDNNRISELQKLGIVYRKSLDFEKELDVYTTSLVLAQICGMTSAPVPEKLLKYKDRFNSIRANSVTTVQALSQIPVITSQFMADVFFNVFAKVVAVFSAQNSYVIQVWDGSHSEEFSQLADIASLGVQQEIVPYRHPSSYHHLVVNIILYKVARWKNVVIQLEEGDIVLFANLHVSKRPLGDLVLAMHEGHEDKRFLIKIPEGHMAGHHVSERCAETMEEVNNLSQNVSRYFHNDNSIQTWGPSQFRNECPDSDGEIEEEIVGLAAKEPSPEESFPIRMETKSLLPANSASPSEISRSIGTEESDTARAPVVERPVVQIEWVKPTPEFLAAAEYFKDSKMPFLPILKKKEHIKQCNPFAKRPFRPNYVVWRALIYSKLTHLWLTQCSKCKKIVEEEEGGVEQKKCCEGGDLQEQLYLLVPLMDDSDLLVQIAITPDILRKLFPNLKSLAKEHCDVKSNSSLSTSWLTEIYEDLKKNKFNKEPDIIIELEIYKRFEDGCILIIDGESTV